MPITAISRDFNEFPNIVRVVSSDTLATVATTDYLIAQASNIAILNSGTWIWYSSDLVLIAASNGVELFTLSSDLNSLIPYANPISGNIEPGLINQAAVYAVAGTTLSGTYQLLDASSEDSLNFNTRQLNIASGTLSLDWQNKLLLDTPGLSALQWGLRHAFANDGSTVVIDWSQPNQVRIGGGASTTGANSVAVGFNALANNANAVALGFGAATGGIHGIVIGDNAKGGNPDAIAIGHDAGHLIAGSGSIALGYNAANSFPAGDNAITIGYNAGNGGVAQPPSTICIGANSVLTGVDSTVVGSGSSDGGFSNSIALGNGATNSANDQAILPAGVTWDPSSQPPTTPRSYTSRATPAFSTPYTPSATNNVSVCVICTYTNIGVQDSAVSIVIAGNTLLKNSIAEVATNDEMSFNFIVPVGQSYQVVNSGSGSQTLNTIWELIL